MKSTEFYYIFQGKRKLPCTRPGWSFRYEPRS